MRGFKREHERLPAVSDPRRLKRALARLAGGGADRTDDPRETIERAVEATEDVDTAAAFVADGGLERLDAAVRSAERDGRFELARRGRRASDAFRAFRAAANGRETPARRGNDLGAEGQSTDR